MTQNITTHDHPTTNPQIPIGWEEVKLGDVLERITKGTTPKGFSQNLNDINYVKSESLSYGGNLDYSKFVKITQKQNDELKRSQLKENDILLSMAGAYLGKSGLVKKEILPANTNQAVAILTTNPKIDYIFLWFKLRSQETVNYFNSIPSQSAQPNINFEEIKSLTLPLPPLLEQKAIAAILSSLDDKIELLRDQNKTLEELGQKLFQKELAENGNDWEERRLGEILKFKSGFAFKGDDFSESSNSKALKIKDIIGQGVVSVANLSSVNIANMESKLIEFLLVEGDILIAMSGNTTGKIGVMSFCKNPVYLNQRAGKLFFSNNIYKEFVYYFLMSENYEQKILSMAYGSAQPNINPQQLENIETKIPSELKMQEFHNLVSPIFSKILANTQQIQTLSKIRDTLLPQLMSARVRVGVLTILK